MAFNMKDILVYSRTAEITIDHTKSIEQALSTLRHIEIKEIVEVDPPKHRDWPQHEQLKIQRQALAYLSTLCCNSNPPISSSAMTYGQATKLDLPLLQTNHEDDLVRFKKGINTMKTKHMEQPRSIDHNKIDKRMDSLDRKAQARIRSDRRTDKDGFTISREALRYLQDVIESKEDHSLNGGAVYSKTADPTRLSSPLVSQETLELAPIASLNNLSPHEVIEIDMETFELSTAQQNNKAISSPLGSRGNPLDIDNLEIVMARCSMTPELGDFQRRSGRSMKLDSPLTPPNTVRPHRKFAATDAKALFRELNMAPPNRIPSPLAEGYTIRDNARFENARAAVERRIAGEQIQPRLVARKIDLPPIGPAWPFSDQPLDWNFENIRWYKHILWKCIKHTRLAGLNGKKMSWAPWAPLYFDPADFWTRFENLIPADMQQFGVISEPLDARTLISLPEDDGDLEDLEPVELAHIDELSALIRKRKGENMQRQKVKIAKTSTDKTSCPSAVVDTSFSDMGFRLLANQKTKFEDLGHQKHSRTGAEPVSRRPSLEHGTRYSSDRPISAPNVAPQPIVSTKDLQLIVTSSGTAARHIVRYLRRVVPNLNDIERDFSTGFHSSSTITSDADILISPTVGIILSSVSEIQQQPLPGTKTMSRIRTRITELAHKFEHLFVLVKTDATTPLICQRLTDIINFSKHHTLLYGTEIEILPCVAKEQQAREVLAIAERYNSAVDGCQLTDHESRGEVWLRKEANLNTFAAQAILHLTASNFKDNREEALATLRRMTDQDRVHRLAPFVGKNCIERLNLAFSRYQDQFLERELQAKEMYDQPVRYGRKTARYKLFLERR